MNCPNRPLAGSDTNRPQVGRKAPRLDARTKVTGQEKYAADQYAPNALWTGVKRSTVAPGRLRAVHVAEALALPGVVAVLTHQDVPGPNRYGVIHHDQQVLVDDLVRRIGDPLALVLAESREALRQGLAAIRAEIESTPGVFDPAEALAEGAPLVHEATPGNLLTEILVEKGLGAAGLDQAPVVVSGHFQTQRQAHVYLETEAGWAWMDDGGRLNIVASTQSPYRDVTEVATALGLDRGRVRVQAPYLGGGFGGKDGVTVQVLLALAALKSAGRPVKMWWDREESMLAGVKRLPAIMDYRLGADRDGRLVALDCEILMDGGAYDHLCGEVLTLAVEHAGGPYRVDHVRVHGRVAYTHNPPGGPFRGFGVPQVTAAVEQMMDILAEQLKIDPLELRRRNAVDRGDRSPIGVTLTGSTGLKECLETLARHPLWTERKEWKSQAGPYRRRGVGLAALSHGSGYGPVVPDYANAKIELNPDGRFLIDAAVPDMGQGNTSTFLQIAGDLLGQGWANLEAVLPDTDSTLPSCSSAAGRTTYTYAQALIQACELMNKHLRERAAAMFMAPDPGEMLLLPGVIRHAPTGRELPLAQLARLLSPTERIQTAFWRAPVTRDKLRAQTKNAFGLGHLVFSYGVHLALVEVDKLTGQVAVVAYLAVTDAGRVINPQTYEQQVHGGLVQGLGLALFEDYPLEQGRGLTPDLATYLVPTALDAPDLISLAVATHEPTGPFGQKGVGEIPINGPLPAVANALADAIAVRWPTAPFTPDRVLKALAETKNELDS